ncbi:MAG: type II secretion system F family protein [Victivallaceae bacterium]|nr:type II secretion system F family protein [Victivallaceae bacterium]
MNILTSTWGPSICVLMAVTIATLVIIDTFLYISARYKERYLKEAAVELDDVLLQMPAGRIFDLSLAISAFCCFMTVIIFGMTSGGFSWVKAIGLGSIVAVGTFPMPRLILRYLRIRRLAKFNEQLEDALGGMSSSLKAGFSINQALESIADENRPPISIEFRLLLQELRLGVPLENALDNMCKRIESEDFELVAVAIITARQTGGELTSVLERLASVIRERLRIHRKVSALTAQGRLQAIVIGIMPFALMFMMSYIVPDAMESFFESVIGIISCVVAVILVIVGFLSIKKITSIKV